jgi:sugar O-acyltransferase (sialic acid O-acetyltransferase NeuD family)
MIICGAGGHAKELYHIFGTSLTNVVFFDNVNPLKHLYDAPVINTEQEISSHFLTDNRFVIGTGNPLVRFKFHTLMTQLGGALFTVQHHQSSTGLCNSRNYEADIFPFSFIGPEVTIGKGTLINTRANIHHNTSIGEFCEISPGAILLGNVKVGDQSMIGSGAVVLPGITVGNNAQIGAGAVVTKNIPDQVTAKGIPAIYI